MCLPERITTVHTNADAIWIKCLMTPVFAYNVSGSDSRIRLWDIESGCNTLLNFETGRIQTNKAIQLATSDDPALVFVPCMKTVKVLTPTCYLFYQQIIFIPLLSLFN